MGAVRTAGFCESRKILFVGFVDQTYAVRDARNNGGGEKGRKIMTDRDLQDGESVMRTIIASPSEVVGRFGN